MVEFRAEDGTLGEGLMGHICGAGHFGEVSWQRHVKAHEDRVKVSSLKAQCESLIADCKRLHPQMKRLTDAVELVDRARASLQSKGSDLFRICLEATRRNDGLVQVQDWSGRTLAIRLRHRAFWTRPDHSTSMKLANLLRNLRDFQMRVEQADSANRLSGLISAIGSPSQQAREILSEIENDIRALHEENLFEIIPLVNEITERKRLRVKKGVIEYTADYWPTAGSRWDTLLVTDTFPLLLQTVERMKAATAIRTAA
ncbi:hypothetical protein [Roseomonas chloroacetimidivorans]|uniref:hypothetical protein n=1 Tax=Roseomonas chloroacetimidivorans TaxID=1766656 RepID=UPI003C710936